MVLILKQNGHSGFTGNALRFLTVFLAFLFWYLWRFPIRQINPSTSQRLVQVDNRYTH